MTTVRQFLELAGRDSGVLGVGQQFSYQDVNDAFRRLNMMLQQWNSRRWLVYVLDDNSVPCTGATSYTIGLDPLGVDGDYAIRRPDRLEGAYIRQVVPQNPTPVDWSLKLIQSREEYSQITLKRLAAAPSQYIFYESSYPLGRVYPWPLPNNQYELHILTKRALQSFDNLADAINMPEEYNLALHASTVCMLRGAFRLPADPYWTGQAKSTLATLRKSNFQVGRMSLPTPMTQGPAYNIFSDSGG